MILIETWNCNICFWYPKFRIYIEWLLIEHFFTALIAASKLGDETELKNIIKLKKYPVNATDNGSGDINFLSENF